MGCLFRPKANALWSIWYTIITVTCICYLLYVGLMEYPVYAEARYPNTGRPDFFLNVYIVLHAVVIGLLLIFIGSGMFKVGNLASDNERLGEPTRKPVIEVDGGPCCRCIRSVWRHAPPVAQTVHLVMTMCLLMAHYFMQTEMFRNNIIRKEHFWTMAPLEFIFSSQVQLRSLFPNSSVNLHLGRVPPNLTPTVARPLMYGVPLDFFMHLLGLLVFTITYPSVFSKVSKCFSFLFSIQLLVFGLDAICSFLGFALMFRLHQVSYITGARELKHLHQLLNPQLLVAVYLTTAALSYVASALMYSYGYGRYCLAVLAARGQPRIIKPRCDGYMPNGGAIVMLVFLVVCRAPMFYDQLLLTQLVEPAHQIKLLVCIAASVLFLFTWLILWLVLTLRRDWGFNVGDAVISIPELGALLVAYGNDTYVTDDPNKKQAILSLVDKNRGADAEVYWLKPSSGQAQGTGIGVEQTVGHENPVGVINHVGGSIRSASGQQSPAEVRQDMMEWQGNRQEEVHGGSMGPPEMGETWVASGAGQRHGSVGSYRGGSHGGGVVGQRRAIVPRGSGSYIRFNDESSSNYEVDPVTTFGTLPRNADPMRTAEYYQQKRRAYQQQQMHHQQQQYQQQSVALLDSENEGSVTPTATCPTGAGNGAYYSAVQKKAPSPAPSFNRGPGPPPRMSQPVNEGSGRQVNGGVMSQSHGQFNGNGHPNDPNMSRTSSYTNVPATHRTSQSSWEDGSLGSGGGVGAVRVIAYADPAYHPPSHSSFTPSVNSSVGGGSSASRNSTSHGPSYSPETLAIPRASPGNGRRVYDPSGRPPHAPSAASTAGILPPHPHTTPNYQFKNNASQMSSFSTGVNSGIGADMGGQYGSIRDTSTPQQDLNNSFGYSSYPITNAISNYVYGGGHDGDLYVSAATNRGEPGKANSNGHNNPQHNAAFRGSYEQTNGIDEVPIPSNYAQPIVINTTISNSRHVLNSYSQPHTDGSESGVSGASTATLTPTSPYNSLPLPPPNTLRIDPQDDSANFSFTSSNESEHPQSQQYVTSIV